MRVEVLPDRESATRAAADWLAHRLTRKGTRTLMVAGGNTPLGLYAAIAARGLSLAHLTVFALDEYVGVPEGDPRTCANLLGRTVRDAWRIAPERFHALSPAESKALAALREHERRIEAAGGLDLIVLGLGQNGHLGFNEPGSAADSPGRLIDLDPTSTEANRKWFGGDHAPSRGVTVGMRTILAAREALLLAFGPDKAPAVARMIQGPPGAACPASFLQGHPRAHVILDEAAAGLLLPERP